jgi:chromosome segregation ATPase
VNAKSDIQYLTKTLDEMHEAESSRCASLEFSLSTLAAQLNDTRRVLNSDIELLRNELGQISIERDHLFEALKDCEKSKEILVRASSVSRDVTDDSDLQHEVVQLRIEKAQLLASAEQEASRVERRLRESQAISRISTDSDVLLERDLRESLENALEITKKELLSLRSEMLSTKSNEIKNQESFATFEKELNYFRQENHNLRAEIQSLYAKNSEEKRRALTEIQRLKDECNLVKVRSLHSERKSHFGMDLRSELAKLQTLENMSPANDSKFPSDDSDHHAHISKLYDVIQEQKTAIEEERSLYLSVLAQHDDLLAVLAQDQLIRNHLESSLKLHAGQGAVDDAIEEAEKSARAQYGNFVRSLRT